jgi:hypothetical protein
VKIEIRGKTSAKNILTTAILNTGYESEQPELTIPEKVGKLLGILPKAPHHATLSAFKTAGGIIDMLYLEKEANIRIVCKDKISRFITCNLAISHFEDEILISDVAIEKLRVEIINPGKGMWRFKGEKKLRTSELPQKWERE